MSNILRSKTAKAAVTALLLCVAPTFTLEVRAQRTMRGENLIEANAVSSPQFPAVSGAQVHYGRYMLGSYWKAGLSGVHYGPAGDEYGVTGGSLHLVAEGEWMYRLLGTRNRQFNLYGGGGIFLGCERTGGWQDLTGDSLEAEDMYFFLYGIQPSLEAELFITRKIALVLSGSAPINFSSQQGHLHLSASAGVRVNF